MDCDFLVIGGGIAGAGAAYELAGQGSVVLLERETTPGYHTTGRSAAMYLENYGEPLVRALASCSRGFLADPPEGFAGHSMLTPRGVLYIAREDQRAALEALLAADRDGATTLEEVDAARVRAMIPVLRPGYVDAALLEAGAAELDVATLHNGFLRGFRARGGTLITDAGVTALERSGGVWRATTAAGEMAGAVVVDAAGAWADEIAVLAGVAPVGLVPKRRTAFTFDPPEAVDPGAWPMAVDIDEQFYFKPEAGQILGSPADETPMPPCDIQPDELDIAIAVDRIQRAASFDIRRINHRWAGLRSFVADHLPVVGYATGVEGFFWLAGQGGIGIMTAPAISRLAAALVLGREPHVDLAERGIGAAALSPDRVHGVLR